MQPHQPGDRAGARHAREGPIGRRDQAPGECDSFRLVAVEKRRVRASMQDGGELPGQVHRVADAGVHALSADRTVDVRGVAEQERAALAEMIGDAMVHAVGREPVHALDVDAHPLDHALAHVVPRQVLVLGVRRLRARCRPAARALRPSAGRPRENRSCPGRRASRRSSPVRSLPRRRHRRGGRTCRPGNRSSAPRARWNARRRIRRCTPPRTFSAVPSGRFRRARTPTARLLEAQQLRPPLDLDAGLGQALDQQALVLVLRERSGRKGTG